MKRTFKRASCVLLALCALASAQVPGNWTPGNQQAVTGSAVQLPSFAARVVCLKAVPGGSQTVFIGGSTVTASTGYPLAPGESVCVPVLNLNQIYVIAASTGSTIAWFGTFN